ncbi:immunoglobulin kappa light chain-like [Polypterus senegalus]|uniref:immunoglobulin kappa light chain-like n=1 Tax=Polypterus senegalus TaxID=55291 RepID=UPI001962AF04|nr:immunoglobulin kappa light chain-like [Polypterus senegalus]XP_039602008.1 immunoglobulin kappa light chain-like [Polypterus senegalus]
MIVCSIFLMLCCRHCVILADFRHVQTVRAQLGDSLSLECSIKLSSQYTLFWFKQTPGEAPQNIVFWSGNLNDDIYYNDRFNQRGRYRVKKRMNSFNLSIISLEITDMGTYYCGVMRQRNILFGNGAEICLTSNKTVRRIFQRPVLKSVRYGDSVTVECVVNRAVFGDVHLIYWLHWTVEGTYHSIRNTHGNKITCAEDSQECVYSLQRQNFSSEDYGMYYCAIVSCGEVIFGNGTEFTDQSNHFELDPVVLVLGMTNILLRDFTNCVCH